MLEYGPHARLGGPFCKDMPHMRAFSREDPNMDVISQHEIMKC